MKILYLIPRFTTGGAEKLVLQYAKHFKKAGFDVAVASVVGGGELAKEFETAGITVFVSRNKTLGSWRRLKKFYRKFSPDLVHSHVFSADLAAYLLVRKPKTKWISTQHNVEFSASVFRKILWKNILKKAEKIVAVSENVMEFDKNIFKIAEDKLILNRNGVELEEWLEVSDNNFDKKILQLATIGRLEKQKGHLYLIKALSELKNYDWQWHVYGDGSLRSQLEVLVNEYGIGDRIMWHGVVNNMAKEYENIDLIVQPSLWEGLSLVAMEAMSAGRIVVGTACVTETLIKDKINGLVVDDKSVESLVVALRYCFENKKDLAGLGLMAREYAKENCGLEKNIDKLEKIYK